jgi:5-methylcytosine-specific restriction endonuclease McrA
LEKKLKVFNLEKFSLNIIQRKEENLRKLLDTNSSLKEIDLFVDDCKHSRKDVKKLILKNKLIPYICNECKNEGFWNDKKLTLQLEHKNGKKNDNRIENLCFLCPNCHSQTPTWGSKNIKRKEKTIPPRKFNVSKEELERLVREYPFKKIAKMFSVTDNAIRKRCNVLQIEIPKFPAGYWIKKN